MNSKILLVFILVFLGACGVKGPPEIPPGTAIPSYVDSFTATKTGP